MKMTRHMGVNIQGLLNNYKGRKINILSDDEGNELTDQEARIHLHNLQIQGHKYMCTSSKCIGFDPFEKGCPGHPVAEKALSIKQPWAHLIAAGIKDIENRTWKTTFRGRIYIHASQKPAFPVSESILYLSYKQWDILPINVQDLLYVNYFAVHNTAIIGEVDIIDCVLGHESIWAEHTANVMRKVDGIPQLVEVPVWNWVLENPVLYDKPIENVKGKLSFWEYTQ